MAPGSGSRHARSQSISTDSQHINDSCPRSSGLAHECCRLSRANPFYNRALAGSVPNSSSRCGLATENRCSRMADTFTPERRRELMQAVRGTGTLPEQLVRRSLHRAGLRFARSARRLPGKPDVVLPRRRAVVFVHGCFWHGHQGCRRGQPPKTNTQWWIDKVERNRERDQRVQRELKASGWRVYCLWACTDLTAARLADLASELKEVGAE